MKNKNEETAMHEDMTGSEFIELCRKIANDDGITIKESREILSEIKGSAIHAVVQTCSRYGWIGLTTIFEVEADFSPKRIFNVEVADGGDSLEFIYSDGYDSGTSSCFKVDVDTVARWVDRDFSVEDEGIRSRIRTSLNNQIDSDRQRIEYSSKDIANCEGILKMVDDSNAKIEDVIKEYDALIDDAV